MALVGRVARPHGIRGQLIVNPETDFPWERFRPGAVLFARPEGVVFAVTITTVRFQQGRPVIGLRGVEDVNAALVYAGGELRVPADTLMALPAGAYYHHQLVGCTVTTREGMAVGVVREVQGSAGATRLVVDAGDAAATEVLIPLAVEICVSIEPLARQIVVDPPDGLLALNAPDPRGSRSHRRWVARKRRMNKPVGSHGPGR